MALVLKDRVKESSSSSGTGNIALGGAFVGYQTFNSAVASGSTVYYTIHNLAAGSDNEWEVGVGTFTAPSTLSRDTILSSSNAGSIVNFTSGTSGLEVFITQPAEEAVYINQATGKVEAFGNGTNSISFSTVVADTVTLTAGTISTNAANATDITNKQYVDGLFSTGISYHAPVLVESPTALTATYNQPGGAGNGVGATLTNSGANVALVIDGVTVSNTARVLIYTQANAAHNGIYTVTNPGAPDSPGPGSQWVLTRATDADTFGLADPNALGQGDAVFVQSGDTGAGETYVCNTPGTITFGTTNITFSQISSAQIYSAGTGLSLNNTTFSIANTAVTAAQYGNDGNVAQITVNSQGQITNASNVAINASNITVGTLSNDRTTANSSNGANTIVLRDSTGSFNANVVTATTVNATSGNFTNISANASGLTDINASNISSGTIANARTTGNTANSANTLVLRDANGSFGANVVTASFSGDGSAITGINASNISSGTIANARTTAASSNGANTIVLRDLSGNFEANTVNAAALIGNASQVTAINASNISTGTIANARTSASSSNGASTIVLRGASGEFAAGAITGTSFSGNGASITDINASAISTGTIANARTTASSANGANTIVSRDANGSFAANVVTGTTLSGALSASTGTFSGTATFNGGIAPSFIINRQGGSEGGEFQMQLPASGTSLAGNVVVDVFENSLRIYENGGSTRGAALDITAQGSIASTQIITSSSTTGINASAISTGTLAVGRGGTGQTTLTADNVVLGNGTNAVKFVAPGTNGNVLTSNGTTWVSSAVPAGAAATPSALGTVYGKNATATPFDVFYGYQAGNASTGAGNTYIGYQSGLATTTGAQNAALGYQALASGTALTQSTAVGYQAFKAATGTGNTGLGWNVGYQLASGNYNTGVGWQSMASSNGSSNNTSMGANALVTGPVQNSTAIGSHAGQNTTGNDNTYLGFFAGTGVTSGANNTILGSGAGNTGTILTTGSNNILIGHQATPTSATVSNETTIGRSATTSARIFGDLKFLNSYTETVFAVTGTTPALSPTNGTIQTWTLSGASTPTQGTWAAGQSMTLQVTAGSNTITWSSIPVTWIGGVAPTLSTTGVTIIELWKVGTTVYGALVGSA